MSTNPYQSPAEIDSPVAEMLPDRAAALRRIHLAMLVLAIPVALNFLCWHLFVVRFHGGSIVFGVINATDALLFSMFLWFVSLKLLEYVAVALHFVFGGPVSRQEWLSIMYRSLWPLAWAAPAGAAVWVLWLMLIYGLRVNFMVASVPLGIIGHLLGAWVYLTIFHNWYRARMR